MMDKKIVIGVVVACLVLLVGGVVVASKSRPVSDNPTVVSTNDNKAIDLNINDKDWIKGKADAPVTLVEYGDFQCPACGAYYELLTEMTKEMPDKFRLVFRNYPLTNIHDKAWTAAKAAEAAGKQGKFWEMYDKLFSNQETWGKELLAKFNQTVEGFAKDIGLNMDQFMKDMASSEVEAAVKEDWDIGNKLNIKGTPTFYVNGVLTNLPGSKENFVKIINQEADKAPAKPEAQKVHEHADFTLFVSGKKFSLSDKKYDEKNPDVHIHDAFGDIIHKHKSDATLGKFYESLGLTTTKPTVMYLNGKKYDGKWEDYSFKDLDRIALANADLMPFQVNSVTDKACIYSEKCPERGKAPTENCVGGLDKPCEASEE